jgi:hypothetical protein
MRGSANMRSLAQHFVKPSDGIAAPHPALTRHLLPARKSGLPDLRIQESEVG